MKNTNEFSLPAPADHQIAELAAEMGLPYGPDTWEALKNFAYGVPLLTLHVTPSLINTQQQLRMLGYELEAVIRDTEHSEFDETCMNTVKRVRTALSQLSKTVLMQDQKFEAVGWFNEVAKDEWYQSIDPHDPKNAQYIKDGELTFEGTVQLYALKSATPAQVTTPEQTQTSSAPAHQFPSNTPAGFKAGFHCQHRRHATEQEIWNAAVASGMRRAPKTMD